MSKFKTQMQAAKAGTITPEIALEKKRMLTPKSCAKASLAAKCVFRAT